MFGHLRAEEFMSLIEDGKASAECRSHLTECAACRTRLDAVKATYNGVYSEDAGIPEPDWTEFRSSVRLELLSRSVQRESAVRRWTGWPIRPAMAWGLSLLLLVMVSTGGFLWHISKDSENSKLLSNATVDRDDSTDVASVPAALDTDMSTWTSPGVFEELAQLEEPQAKQLQALLQSAQKGLPDPQ